MRNNSVNTCGTSCSPCATPPNARATCDGTACGYFCRPGYVQCGSACVTSLNDAGVCTPGCSSGSHACGTTCSSNSASASCGGSCTPCPTVPNATAACDGLTCIAACTPGYYDCDGVYATGCESAVRCDVPDAGLVAYYPFTGSAQDLSGSGAHGSVVGAVLTQDRKGSTQRAYGFTAASSQYISMATNPRLPVGATGRTLSVWYRGYALTNTYQSLVNWGAASSNARFGLSLYSNGTLFFTGQYNDVSTSTNVSDSRWHHLAVTWNGVLVVVYVDGVEVARRALSDLNTSGANLLVGQKIGLNGEFANGELDDLRVYDWVLNPSQLDALFRE